MQFVNFMRCYLSVCAAAGYFANSHNCGHRQSTNNNNHHLAVATDYNCRKINHDTLQIKSAILLWLCAIFSIGSVQKWTTGERTDSCQFMKNILFSWYIGCKMSVATLCLSKTKSLIISLVIFIIGIGFCIVCNHSGETSHFKTNTLFQSIIAINLVFHLNGELFSICMIIASSQSVKCCKW